MQKGCRADFSYLNGEGDLVVMDIETCNRREKIMKLHEELLAVEEIGLRIKGCILDEVIAGV